MMLQLAFFVACILPQESTDQPGRQQEPTQQKQAEKLEFAIKRRIVYSKAGERDLLLDAYVPKKDGTYPAVLVVHGGAWATGSRNQLARYATALAEMGMACFAIDYRLAPKHKWPAQIDDCRAAVKWIRKHANEYKVDPQRLGAIGYSAGGHLVSLLATSGEAPNKKNGNVDTRLQAVAAGGAPAEFRKFPDNGKFLRFLMGGDLDSVPEKFKSASPAVFLDKKDPPIFFWNGTTDRLVPMDWTKPFYEEVKKNGIKTEMHTVKGRGHMLTAMNREALDKAFEFLKRELAKKSPPQTNNKTNEKPE